MTMRSRLRLAVALTIALLGVALAFAVVPPSRSSEAFACAAPAGDWCGPH
jgi:hypothetical protein